VVEVVSDPQRSEVRVGSVATKIVVAFPNGFADCGHRVVGVAPSVLRPNSWWECSVGERERDAHGPEAGGEAIIPRVAGRIGWKLGGEAGQPRMIAQANEDPPQEFAALVCLPAVDGMPRDLGQRSPMLRERLLEQPARLGQPALFGQMLVHFREPGPATSSVVGHIRIRAGRALLQLQRL